MNGITTFSAIYSYALRWASGGGGTYETEEEDRSLDTIVFDIKDKNVFWIWWTKIKEYKL